MEQEPPLSDWELRIMRQMMEEYRRDSNRKEALSGLWKDGKSLAVIFGAIAIFSVQVATFVLAIKGHS